MAKDTIEEKNKEEQIAEQTAKTEGKQENPPVSERGSVSSAQKKANKKRLIFKGQAHIQCTYNNTMILVTDLSGAVLGWSSSGLLGFKGAKKSTPYAATQVVSDLVEKVRKYQMKELEVFVKGVGSGREAAIRAFSNNGFVLLSIKDLTPIPHNGCRPKRPRRV